MKFLREIKNHWFFFNVSVFLILLFFAIDYLIANRITDVTKDLTGQVMRQRLISQKNTLTSLLDELDAYAIHARSVLDSAARPDDKEILSKLAMVSEFSLAHDNIVSSWAYVRDVQTGTKKIFSQFSETDSESQVLNLISHVGLHTDTLVSEIVRDQDSIFERKILIKEILPDKVLVFGYDIDLIGFWKKYSYRYPTASGYDVLFDESGICLFHPESKYIGQRLDSYFKEVTSDQVFHRARELEKEPFPSLQKLLSTQVLSEFLALDVIRYYDVLNAASERQIIHVISFPVEINKQESILSVKRYFYWISGLTLLTFIVILGLSRLQLKNEFNRNLLYEREKEQLKLMNEQYQRENAVLQLKRLKKVINPHFLFNTLNSLVILIDSNPVLSQDFVLKLSEVYRYLLKDPEKNLITLKEEIDFLETYIFLQQVRFKSSLKVSISNENHRDSTHIFIPFLALETLVENAIKHNQITKKSPLYIDVTVEAEQIVVSNNYNPRIEKETESHQIGLDYLKNVYNYYGDSFRTEIADSKFICYLPLLPK
ncbi:sensor histidine kinase [Reichenbachiella versicolor]|uniref:sensor histidine kinase n=1 Tax=Reichenbachiella versicolor TaxID=1821036 RepID=UPI000D6E31CC|nr:histidine kinase [Reichenbachiella versicolor]